MGRVPTTPLLFLSAVAWAGFVAVTLWTVVFLAGVVVPRTVDGPARTNTAVAVTVDLALLLAVRRTALGDGAPSGQGVAAPPDPRGARAHVVRPRHRHLPRRCCWCCGNPGAARCGTSTGRPRRPVVALRGRLGPGDLGDVRGRPPRAHRASPSRVGGASRGRQDQRARGRRTARHRSTPTDDRTAPGLLGDPADGCFARTIRCRRDRVHRHRNQVRGARPTAHVRRRVRRLRRARPGACCPDSPFRPDVGDRCRGRRGQQCRRTLDDGGSPRTKRAPWRPRQGVWPSPVRCDRGSTPRPSQRRLQTRGRFPLCLPAHGG